MAKPAPITIDIAVLTQEQFDLAMANPGSCKYSGPCIIGAMMPTEFVEYLKTNSSNSYSGAVLDHVDVGVLEGLGLVKFATDEDRAVASRVQIAFDCVDGTGDGIDGTRYSAIELGRLRQLLPQINVPKEIS